MSTLPSGFTSPKGEAAYMAAYEAGMRLWPVPYETIDLTSRFGRTHLVACGPKDAPAMVLLHGALASLTMWAANIVDLSQTYRVYAIDLMGQASKSVPDQPIRTRAESVEWLSSVLDGLGIDRAYLVGMSQGGWVALNYAIGAPERVKKLALLSPAAGFLPLVRQFYWRVIPAMMLKSRPLFDRFVRWMTYPDAQGGGRAGGVYTFMADQMYLGICHFPMREQVAPCVFSDDELRGMDVPTLVLIGEQEVIYDPAAALARAQSLLPHFCGDLIPRSSHDMAFSQSKVVDARILDFFKEPLPIPFGIQRITIDEHR
jgi:pimeloyl-ACP methyl ester carboxylesterase